MTNQEIKAKEAQYFMPTYGRFPIALESGKGVYAKDVEGREYLDFTAGIGVNALGYCDDGWVKAVCSQAATLQHISNLYYNPVQTKLGELLCQATGYSKVFFGNSGAEANECALKLAKKYSVDKYGPGRCHVISLNNSFHGRTITTLAATGQQHYHEHFFPFTPGFVYADPNLESVKKVLHEDVCAIMVEFIQGEGGVLPIEKEFAQQLKALCEEKDILLIADEVQTGVGRTGTFLCSEQYGIRPDITTLAKALASGIPMGACLCTEALGAVLSSGDHGSTFGGNPLASAAAVEVVSRVSQPSFLRDVAEKGAYLKEQLATIPHVKDIRGLGLMLGFSVDGKTSKEIASACLANGLLVLTAKDRVRLLPPLVITKEEIDEGLARLSKTIKGE